MTESRPITILCVAGYEKGAEFIRECKRQGCRVLLLTVEKLAEADWPRDCIDEMHLMPDLENREQVVNGVSYLARTRKIDRIVPLDDYDVELAATLREHLRLAGMGDTTARYFRDKLAMRARARNNGVLVPDFVGILNYDDLRAFMSSIAPPWVLKPRSEAASVGIKKINAAEELWPLLDDLGDRQSYYLLEKFIPGDIFHVDSIVSERDVVFAECHVYGKPPMAVSHEGGIFTTRTLERGSAEEHELMRANMDVMRTLGLVRGVTHTEFIRGHEDRRFYFLETAARVGGANIVELIDASTGVNLWREWAKIEIAGEDGQYAVPQRKDDYAGVIISLARQEWPDTSHFTDPEITYRLHKKHHVGFVVTSRDLGRVKELLDAYAPRIHEEFHAALPPSDKPTS